MLHSQLSTLGVVFRKGNSLFKSKSARPQTSFYGHIVEGKFSTPLRKCLCFSFIVKKPIISFVVSLLQAADPSKVSRKITFFIINTIQSVSRVWAGWDSFLKSGKIQPRLVKKNPSPAVVFESRTRRFSAALYNVVVCSIKFRSAAFSFVSMFIVHSNGLLFG